VRPRQQQFFPIPNQKNGSKSPGVCSKLSLAGTHNEGKEPAIPSNIVKSGRGCVVTQLSLTQVLANSLNLSASLSSFKTFFKKILKKVFLKHILFIFVPGFLQD
jgi:hypothetical protein